MKSLANYVMRGPVQAIVVAAVTGIFSVLPLVSYLSGAAVGLVTLRIGPAKGACKVAGLPKPTD